MSVSDRDVILITMVKTAITMMVTYRCCCSSIFFFWDNFTCIPILSVVFKKLVLSISSEMMMGVKNKVRRVGRSTWSKCRSTGPRSTFLPPTTGSNYQGVRSVANYSMVDMMVAFLGCGKLSFCLKLIKKRPSWSSWSMFFLTANKNT